MPNIISYKKKGSFLVPNCKEQGLLLTLGEISVHSFLLTFKGLLDGGWDAEVLLHQELGADLKPSELGYRGWGTESAGQDVILGVVRNQVLRDAVDNNRHGLLDQAILLEPVRVGERSDQGTLLVLFQCRLGVARA